jgi:hypothetical protein
VILRFPDGSVVHVNRPGPTVRRPTGELKSAVWCARCRRRRIMREVVIEEVEPSWYAPSVRLECPVCKGLR